MSSRRKDEIGAALAKIDQRLPKLSASCLGFSASIVTGVGTCGLGSYADRMERIVREQHLTQFFAKSASTEGKSHHALRLAAIAAAQTAALEQLKEEREEQLMQIAQRTKVERQQEALRRQQRELDLQAQKRELALHLQQEREAAQQLAEARRWQQEQERETQRAVQAMDEENHWMMMQEEAERQEARKHVLRDWVEQSKAHARQQRSELLQVRARDKAAVEQRSKSALEFRGKIEEADTQKRREMVVDRHSEHEQRVYDNEEKKAEHREQRRKLTKTILNMDAIVAERAKGVATVLEATRRKRHENEAVRSVSSMQ